LPIVHSSLDDAAGEITMHDRYHIGIATAQPQGLLVPVIRDARPQGPGQIARDIERAERRSPGRTVAWKTCAAHVHDHVNRRHRRPVGDAGSSTIPKVAILGVDKAVKRPVFDPAGNVKPAEMVYLSLSFDHRVVDGAVGAVFATR